MAAILHENQADDGMIVASSWIAAAPPATLQNHHIARRWKGSNGGADYIVLTWAKPHSFDTVALFGCAVIGADDSERVMSAAATYRLRASSVDTTGIAGDLFDSGIIAGEIHEAYGALIKLLPSPVSAIAVRIDLSESGVNAIMAGRLVVGLRNSLAYNFGYGWSYGYADLSRKLKSAGGQTFIERDDRYRVLNVSFELSERDRYDVVNEIDRICGLSRDVLFILDEDSSQLDRDCLWGLIQDMSPPSQPHIAYFAKTYQIEERR